MFDIYNTILNQNIFLFCAFERYAVKKGCDYSHMAILYYLWINAILIGEAKTILLIMIELLLA